MIIPPFRDWKIGTKLVSLTLFLVMFPLLCLAFLSTYQFTNALQNAAEEDLEHLVRNIYSLCQVQQEMTRMQVDFNLNVARELLYRHGHDVEIFPEQKIRFEVDRSVDKKRIIVLPRLKIGDLSLSENYVFVDEVHKLVGGICTLFQRTEDDRFIRIATNVTGSANKRALGTMLTADSPVSQSILRGEIYRGRIYAEGEWYIKAYEPLRDREGRVVGALCVGVTEQNGYFIKKEIKSIKVGETGYAYIMDSKGNLKIHPAKEGENILGAKDSSGFEYIRAMITEALTLKEGEVGTIQYPWVNPELGEKTPRQKISKFIYFKPWDWIIAAGTYEGEIYRSMYETERFILIVVLVSVVLVLFLTLTLSKFLTRPIRELTRVTTMMAGGDLSRRVKERSKDEIGLLGKSFNQMVSQIEDYTSNLEKMVEARTRELKDSREKYRDLSRFLNSILDSATEYAIIALDFYGNIIEFNKGAEKLFGWEKKEVLNVENITITIIPEYRGQGVQEEISRKTREEGVCELETELITKEGRHFPAYITVTAIKDTGGKVTGFLEIIRDITLRKSLEKELRETKEFLENIMESSVDGIVTTNLKGQITYLNRAMEEMLKYPREEMAARHISNFYGKGIQQARDIMELLKRDERIENYEMEMKTRGEEVLAILASIFMLRDEGNRIIGTAGILKNITENKRLEAELKTAQANLIEASKMRALGELVSGVAHELNNPLMASQTILHVILKNLHENCPNQERLELIKKCNDRIEKIVEHLKEFSRQSKPEFQMIDINQPMENALLINGQQLLDHNISIVRELGKGLPLIAADANQLEQVFLNLLSNAMDAMDEIKGPKKLIIRSYLSGDGEAGPPSVALSVKDNGVGIPEENLGKVLEPFFSTKPVGRGTGLGLSLCFGIIEAHGGRIDIKSKISEGTEITVFIPLRPSTKE